MAGRCTAVLLLAIAFVAAGAGAATAHPLSTSAVLLDVGSDEVTGEVQLPVDRLAVAWDEELSPALAAGQRLPAIQRYVREHVSASGGGTTWTTAVEGGRIERIDAADHLVMDLTLTPASGEVRDFALSYDVIIEELRTHEAFATIRTHWDTGTVGYRSRALGVYDWSTTSLQVDTDGGSWFQGFTATVGLGTKHIGEGADHLLFLLTLLLPAPLIARRRRWQTGRSARSSAIRVVHVVTAFAIGHSITLAIAAAGLVDLPSAPVEFVIALSIAVSAVHAIRPLVPGGEALIALGFGLVHGLAFAALIADLGLDRVSLVSSLFGFNVGIELAQLLVVALFMPSLYVLSRTRAYTPVRIGLGVLALAAAVGWMVDRAGLATDPFDGVTTTLVEHPFTVAAAFALFAGLVSALPITRPKEPLPT